MPAALSPRMRAELVRVPCGISALDELLRGGLPLGVLTEVVGAECSGRTTMALAYVAALTQAGNVCAWIDVADALDPQTAAANGVDMERLLWVRCGRGKEIPHETVPEPCQNPMGHQETFYAPFPHTGGGGRHPRSEAHGMPEAIGFLLHAHGGLHDHQLRREKKAVGTPGVSNRPLIWRSENREEQANSDRLPPRRGEALVKAPRSAQIRSINSLQAGKLPHKRTGSPDGLRAGSIASKPWQALDQALRAADLLLQGGGFSALVLDLGSTPAEVAWRVSLATWFRFRAACERTRVSLLLLTQHPCARSSAELIVRLKPGDLESENKVMTGIGYRGEVERSRSQGTEARVLPIRKPPQSERLVHPRPGQWKSEAAWALAK